MEEKYGILLNKSLLLQRRYFNEMVKLIGIQVIYRAPIDPTKTYNTQSELISKYEDPIQVGCIFNDHPDQKTLKKMQWVSELQENASIIHVPYDLKGLQKGALFYIPSGLDNSPSRLFRVTEMSNIMVYPASIACEIVPEFEDKIESDLMRDFASRNFTLLKQEEDKNS